MQAAANTELIQYQLADIHHRGCIGRLEQSFDSAVQGHDIPGRNGRLG